MKSRNNTKKSIFKVAIGSGLGLGLMPIAPGSFGALLGVLLHIVVVVYFPANTQFLSLLIIFISICVANHVLASWAQAYWQSKDPKQFILDEIAGYLLIPIFFKQGQVFSVALWGFILFRIFDIFKLGPPAKLIDRKLHGPWGILLDDLVSALYSVLIMYFLFWLKPALFF
jgi:phosphatidylglycerophosphatase A